jgi:hypothetical protein
MSIFVAIAHLIDMVKNMATPHKDPETSSSSNDAPPSAASSGDPSAQNTQGSGKCSNSQQKSSAAQPAQTSQTDPNNEEETDGDDNQFVDEATGFLPNMNSSFGDDDEGSNEPGKSFLEIIFSFILDPITAIIKGIIQVVQLVIITINVATHLNRCAKWFVIYVFCTLLYIPISMLFALLNLKNMEKKLWGILNSVDVVIYCIIEKMRGPGQGFHIIKYSDDIREVCFLESVEPTDCSDPNSRKKKKGKKHVSLLNLLGRYIFLFAVIIFMCVFIIYFGKFQKDSQGNQIPISFGILFVSIIFFILCLILPLFTNVFVYVSIITMIPIVFIILSFISHLFTMVYSKDVIYPTEIYTLKPKLEWFASLYILFKTSVVLLPHYVQYGIASIMIFTIVMFCFNIVYLVNPVDTTTSTQTPK